MHTLSMLAHGIFHTPLPTYHHACTAPAATSYHQARQKSLTLPSAPLHSPKLCAHSVLTDQGPNDCSEGRVLRVLWNCRERMLEFSPLPLNPLLFYRVSCSGFSMTALSATRNSAACAPYTMRWSHVRLTCICFSTPMRPFVSAVTVGLLPPTARMAAVPAQYPCLYT